jgi:hypothetical protein
MSGDIEIDDPDVSDGGSENEYSDHEIGREEDDNTDMAEQKFRPDDEENGKLGKSTGTAKPKLDPKDPLRPRRKKARRACFACQRAHLTCGKLVYIAHVFSKDNWPFSCLLFHLATLCRTSQQWLILCSIGDERPCQRCIKRGLADACQDGVRKKAKYLHDAPPEALRPVLGPNYNQVNNGRPNNNGQSTNNTSASDTSPGLNGGFFSQADTSPTYQIFAGNQQTQMPPPLQSRLSYSSQHSPLSPEYTNPNRQNSMAMSLPQVSNDVQNTFFDPSNPALFNFDLEGLNFGNHYGALEFGMLGHMSSGAAETPPKDPNSGSMSSMSDVNFNGGVFGGNMSQYGQTQMYSQEMLPDFVGLNRQDGGSQLFGTTVHHGLPHAYAIATGSASHHSPSTDASPSASMDYHTSPTTNNYTPNATSHAPSAAVNRPPKRQDTKSSGALSGKFGPASVLGKRTRDPSSIYDTVHEPYPYTTAFHSLTAFLQRRFSANKTLRIAKSLASIRPSFISCTKTLNRQDLIFMEKCFQRTLFEYEDFMLNCCTPTLVCRRTGEVAAVNKEFTLLTGWKKDVLLGKEANLNINTGKGGSENTSGPASLGNTGKAGLTTPRMRPISIGDGATKEARPQAVFLAELLDDDSVIEFYEDFARLAFGDSRGSVTTRCKLLKYQTKEAVEGSSDERETKKKEISGGIGGMGNRIREIDAEHGIGRLERDGKMDCSYCWTVKRDVFDIPMLIVMNVSLRPYLFEIVLIIWSSSYLASKGMDARNEMELHGTGVTVLRKGKGYRMEISGRNNDLWMASWILLYNGVEFVHDMVDEVQIRTVASVFACGYKSLLPLKRQK